MDDAYCTTGSSPTKPGPLHASRRGSSPPTSFELYGSGPATPCIAVLGGISAGSHLARSSSDPTPGWWDELIGPNFGLDPETGALLSIDYLRPAPGFSQQARPTAADQANALARVLDTLGIDRLSAVVGASYGGLVALHFAALHPARLERAVLVVGAHRSHPWASGARHVQRRIVDMGRACGQATEAVAVARALAMLTYGTPEGWAERFSASPDDGAPASPGEFLDKDAEAFARRFESEHFLALVASLEEDAIDPAGVRVPLTALSVAGDLLAPPWLVEELVRLAGGPARHVRLQSDAGHDAFLDDLAVVGPALREALEPPVLETPVRQTPVRQPPALEVVR